MACPFNAKIINPGDSVLDICAGSGADTFIASSLVGKSGKVYALDMTVAMLEQHRKLMQENSFDNIELLEGNADDIPLSDESVDIVTSNGVINLVPDKNQVRIIGY